MGPFQSVTYGAETRNIGRWYDDEGLFVAYAEPWFMRGARAAIGAGAGVFGFGGHFGSANSDISFRVILAI